VNDSPEQLKSRAQEAYQQDDCELAARLYRRAAQAYRQGDDAIMAAEMENNLSVVLLQAGDAQAALEAVQGTPEIFAQAEETRREALAYGNLAAAHQSLKNYALAEEAYLQSAELLGELGEMELRASVMRFLSEMQLRSGRQLEAVASMHAGLDGLSRPSLKQRLVKKLLESPFQFLNRS
jgi:tetratricopeptide (TPR) repeat protein